MHNATFAIEPRMLELKDVSCVRGERTLFSAIDFTVEKATLLRVGGANGTGKTSLLRIICGLMLPAHGEVRWQGENIRTLREEYWRNLVYVGHMNALKDDLTAVENLAMGAALAGRTIEQERAHDALNAFDLAHCALLPVRVLSQGQRRRVALARLVMSRSVPLWVLDEPFTALDAHAVQFVQRLVGEHVTAGGAAILTTHQEISIDAPGQRRLDLGAC
jgi:heme exporter protein A